MCDHLHFLLKAHVDLKRYELFWIPVPCMSSNIGSCTYPDLCAFGVPSNRTCPKVFVKQNVPCRCPIRKVGTFMFVYIQLLHFNCRVATVFI